MAYPEDQSAPMLPDVEKNALNQPLSVIQLEFSHERQTGPRSHPSGRLMIVLEGRWRCRAHGRAFSLRAGDLLRVAMQVENHNIVEPLSESWLSLSIDSPCCMFLPQDDPDQYLWGV